MKIVFNQYEKFATHSTPIYTNVSYLDPSLGFLELFQAIVAVARGDILRSMTLMLRGNKLLEMAKDIGGLCFIVICKMFFQFISHSIVLQVERSFQKHLSFHQFGVTTLGGYEAILLAFEPPSTYTMIRP